MNFYYKLSLFVVFGLVFNLLNTNLAVAAAVPPSITYSGSGFTEAGANNGSVTGSITATLAEDTFQDTDNDNILDIGTEVTIGNVPAGLTPVVTLSTSSTSTEPTAWTNTGVPEALFWYDVAYGNGRFVAVSGDGGVMYSSDDGESWEMATSSSSFGFNSVTYGNGRFVAVAFSGLGLQRVVYSTDGITWNISDATQANSWNSVTYGNGRFVAVSADGTNRVMHSTDGITWTAASAAAQNDWIAITYGNGRFVAVSFNGTNRVMYSTDGIAWTSASDALMNSQQWNDIAYGNGKFVATSQSGINTLVYSTDGVTWTASTNPINGANGIAYGGGKFVVSGGGGGEDQSLYSTDGINWLTANHNTVGASWFGVTYGNGRFVAVSGDAPQNAQVMYSSGPAPDKIATLTLTGTATTHENANDVANLTFTFANAAFISATSAAAVTNATGPASSGRGINFSDAPVIPPDVILSPSITYSGSGFTEAGANNGSVTGSITATLAEDTFQDTDNDNILDIGTEVTIGNVPAGLTPVVTLSTSSTSTEPTAWTNTGVPEALFWYDVAYGNGRFVAVSGDGGVMYSNDAITWIMATTTGMSLNGITYGNGRFVAVAFTGISSRQIIYSTDGITWNLADAPQQATWSSTAYGNGRFVAVSASAPYNAMYSYDAITWTAASSTGSQQWTSIAYGNGRFVSLAFDGSNRVMYSTDGITWTAASSAIADNGEWLDITYGNGRFVAVGQSGVNRLMYSTDGITWITPTNPLPHLSGVAYGGGKYVAVGELDTGGGPDQMIYSIDAVNWSVVDLNTVDATWYGVAYGNGRFVSISGDAPQNAQVMYSSGPAPDKIATLTLTGTSTSHENANDVANLTFTFANAAFISATSAAAVTNATGPASSGRGIDFENAAAVVSSGGGGGGGGGSSKYCNDPAATNYKFNGKGKASIDVCKYVSNTVTATGTPSKVETGTTKLETLLARIAELRALLAKLQGVTTPSTSSCVLTRNLSVGMNGEDVKCLQIYLNKKGFVIAKTGPGAPGFETTYFGTATAKALAKFQEANASVILTPVGLLKGSGFVGLRTRNFINSN